MNRAYLLSILTAASLLSACASTGTYVDPSRLSEFKKGQTSMDQVTQTLGQPSSHFQDGMGDTILMYTYAEASSRPESFIPIIGPLVGGQDMRSNNVSLTFDQNGILKNTSSSGSQMGTGMGLSSGIYNQRVDGNGRPMTN